MRILITGGLGFIGTNLLEALQGTGDAITVLDNEAVGKRADAAGLSAQIVIGDLGDDDVVDELVRSCDAVIHLAAATRVIDSIQDPVHSFDVNVRASFSLIEAMRRHGKRRILFASTGGAIIGDAKPPLHEELVPRPISPYGASKLAIEGYLGAYARSYGMLPIAFRFSNVYGPRSSHKESVVAAFFKNVIEGSGISVYGTGEQTRDFVFVQDLTATMVAALRHDRTGVYQLGSGRETSLNELLRNMSVVVGEDLFGRVEYKPKRVGEVEHVACDISLARRDLGFEPMTGLQEGLRPTWAWFKAHQQT